jgi:DNA-binding ferritin-like protein
MPIRQTDKGWFWGSKGPFATKQQAQNVAKAAYAHGYKEVAGMEKSIVGEFIGNLLHSATITHFMHLSVSGEGSYAKHKALGKYYEEIVDLTDTLAEAIQGCYGELIEGYPSMFANVNSEPLEYMLMLKDYVTNNRKAMPQESNIQNEIDSIATLIDSTLYKLTYLR